MEMERQQHSRTPQANDPKRDRNSGQRSMGHIEANSRAEGQEDSRRRTISFSSEEPYRRWFGMEILDHAENALDLSRLNDVGVLLFNHDTDKVVGKVIRAWVENHRGMAEVEFDTDDDAEKIFGKVKSGTLKTTSVRYSVDSWEEVVAGKQSADGRFTGPCQIARKWTPLEVSVVSVPADPTVGVGRADTGQTCPLAKMYTLGNGFQPSADHAGGLRYHGMSPILSKLYHDGYMEAVAYEQSKVFEAAVLFAKRETILPAPENGAGKEGAV